MGRQGGSVMQYALIKGVGRGRSNAFYPFTMGGRGGLGLKKRGEGA